MNTTKGTSEQSLAYNSSTSGVRTIYFTKFVSEQIAQSSIAANTWTYNFAAHQTSSALNFPVTSSGPTQAVLYVWRPSNSTKVGTIFEGDTASTITEGGTNTKASHTTTFSGAQVTGIQTGDRLVFEAWISHNSGTTNPHTGTYYYDGTVITLTETFVTDHASFIETPETISLGAGTTTVSQTSIQKYNLRVNVAATTSIQKYNLKAYITQTSIQKYRLGGLVLQAIIAKYHIRNLVAATTNIQKYNLRRFVTATTSIHKYNMRLNVLQTIIHKYGLGGVITQSTTHKYNILSLFAPIPMSPSATKTFRKFLKKL